MDLIERLRAEIESIPGPLSRQKIMNRRNEIKTRSRARRHTTAGDGSNEEIAGPSTDLPNGASDNVVLTTIEKKEAISAIMMTPGRAEAARLANDYVQGGEPRCLRVGDQMTNTTMTMIVMRLIDLPVIAGKLPFWKVKRFSRLILCEKPETPDVTQATVIAISGKSSADILKALQPWPTETNPASLCQHLLDHIKGRRVHLFAKVNTPGWESVIGDDNWSTELSDV
jgi:hypothetical protein